MRHLVVKLEKDALEWAEKEEELNQKKLNKHAGIEQQSGSKGSVS